MRGLRHRVSLLLDHGHPNAWDYSVGKVTIEAELVEERQDKRSASNAALHQMAILATKSKKGAQAFKELIDGLMGE